MRTFIPFLLLLLQSQAATLPTGFTETPITGLNSPTAMAFSPDGRLFVCQQGGQLRVIKNGALLPAPFLSLTVDSNGERGLLGITFDPNFLTNNFLYVYYTSTTPATHNRISRFTANGDVALPGSETIIADFENLSSATNHNGGAIHFGPDGKLYAALGENANPPNSQSLNTRLGKILRINPDGSIPADNPFFNQTTGLNRMIWALGLRNPFTFDFQPGTGRLFINDVGQNTFEEINDGIAGSNYGWPTAEGPANPPNPAFRDPLFYYDHSSGQCAITGGTFYNPPTPTFPSTYTGKYFFADYCAGWIRYIDPASPSTANGFATGINAPVDLHTGPEGSLYYLARGAGAVYRIDYTGSLKPNITQHPQSITVAQGQPATFSVSATGAPTLTYQWQRGTQDIPGETNPAYTLAHAALSDNGATFRVIVTNPNGSATSNPATLTVTPAQPPVPVITTPAPGATYAAGDILSYSGTATDPQDGTLPASSFCWQIDFHHDTHLHPFLPQTCGAKSGSIAIPTSGETSANVFYRVMLTVQNSAGLSVTVSRDVLPRTVTLTLQSTPSGLTLTLDGQPVTTPYSVLGVTGILRTLGAASQSAPGTRYNFLSWSDSGAATHTISTPTASTTYTAAFNTQFFLSTSINPPNAGTITASPSSPDSFYDSGTPVQLTANPSTGLAFSGWSGDLTGLANPQNILLSAPRSVTANFSLSTGCAPILSRAGWVSGAEGDLGRVDLAYPSTCSWTASSDSPWITFLTPTSGAGNATIRFRIAPNSGPLRHGQLTLAGANFSVDQAQANCNVQLAPLPLTAPASSGTANFPVSNPGCELATLASPAWLTISSIAPNVINVAFSANPAASARTGNVSVNGQIQQILQQSPNPTPVFTDVPATHPYFDFINLLKQQAITRGCTAATYCPEDNVTRGQMAVFIIRSLLGDSFNYSPTPAFTDVPSSHPYFSYIQKMKELNITQGCTAATYCPDDNVTRGQMAAFLIRARLAIDPASPVPGPANPYFTDVPTTHIYFPYIQKLRQLAITSGCSLSTYCPDAATTRGQMAVFLIRAFFTP